VWQALLLKAAASGDFNLFYFTQPNKKMNLIRSALRRPITILVIVAGIVFLRIRAVQTVKG